MSELPPVTQEEITREQIDEFAEMISYFMPYMQDDGSSENILAAQFGVEDGILQIGLKQKVDEDWDFNGAIIVRDFSQVEENYVISTSYTIVKNDELVNASVKQDTAWHVGNGEMEVSKAPESELWTEYTNASQEDKDEILERIIEIQTREAEFASQFGVPAHGFTQDKFYEIKGLLMQVDPIKDIIEFDET